MWSSRILTTYESMRQISSYFLLACFLTVAEVDPYYAIFCFYPLFMCYSVVPMDACWN